MKKLHKITVLILFAFVVSNYSYSQGVKISASGGDPDGSAILEIESTTQGLLIPRMTTGQRTSILNPVAGLLVFDTEENAFFIYGSAKWVDLSMSSEIWSQTTSNVYLTNSLKNVGIGTTTPSGKFVIKADGLKGPDDALFEIQDASGKPIFVVTSEGARIYVKDYTKTKGVSGGFAVGRYGAAKGLPDTTYFLVTPDSTRVFVQDNKTKGVSGGFAVGRYGAAKGIDKPFFTTNEDETRIFTSDALKGVSGGFAVGRYGAAKAVDTFYFYTNTDSTRVYTKDAGKGISGGFAVGRYGAAKGSSDNYVHVVNNNAFIGYSAGYNTTTGTENIFIGSNAGVNNTTGSNNVFIGNSSGSNAAGSGMVGNVFIGNQAGTGETGSNKLYISNNAASYQGALIYGDFTVGSELVNLNGNLRFNTGGNTIAMPSLRGNNNEVLTMGAGGSTNWEDVNNLIIPKRIEVTFENNFDFKVDDNIGTLIVKTLDGEMRTLLPQVEKNFDRIIKIKNARTGSNMLLFSQNPDVIEGVSKQPLIIDAGETYTFQAGIDTGTDLLTWFIIDYSSDALENINTLMIVTDQDYNFNTEPEAPRVYTLILKGSGQNILLPASSEYPNRMIVIKNSQDGKATIHADGTDDIDGNLTLTLNTGLESVTLQSDGLGSWYIINKYK